MIASADEFRRLRASDDAEEQRRAALDYADVAVWLEVIDRYPELRQWVAHNKTVPLSILQILAKDGHRRVRRSVAVKRKLDSGLFELLAHEAASVRHAIACNRKAPTDVLLRLSRDNERFVADAAAERL